jgi:hypothetical protein
VAALARDSAETAGSGDDIKPGVSNQHRHMVAGGRRASSTRSLMRLQTLLNGTRRAETYR